MASTTSALSSTAAAAAARVAPASSKAAGRSTPMGTVRPSRGSSVVAHAEIAGLSACGNFQELCKAEIPAKIPRHDFLKQMYRYMIIAYQDNGLAAYGKRMSIDLVDGSDGLTNGMCVNIFGIKDGTEVKICDLYCEMDTEQVPTFDTLMPNQDGELIKTNRSGKDEFITGRYFVIRRPVPFDEDSNAALKAMIKDLTLAINKYYAFGSCFSDDST